jgi:hypothetical protein
MFQTDVRQDGSLICAMGSEEDKDATEGECPLLTPTRLFSLRLGLRPGLIYAGDLSFYNSVEASL